MTNLEEMNQALEQAGNHLLKRLRRHARRRWVMCPVFWMKRYSKAVKCWKDALNR